MIQDSSNFDRQFRPDLAVTDLEISKARYSSKVDSAIVTTRRGRIRAPQWTDGLTACRIHRSVSPHTDARIRNFQVRLLRCLAQCSTHQIVDVETGAMTLIEALITEWQLPVTATTSRLTL